MWMNIPTKQVWISLWFEKFNSSQRVALWNKLKFPELYYRELEKDNPTKDYSSIESLFDIKIPEEEIKSEIKVSYDSDEDTPRKSTISEGESILHT